MKIAVVGLGLIGGSICKSLKKNTFHYIMGTDIDGAVCEKALACGAIDEVIKPEQLGEADMTIICLYPEQIVKFVNEYADVFKPGSIVTDSCGVKEYVVEGCTAVLAERGVIFVGSHPMAGREFSGFDYSTDDLFVGASYIVTPTEDTPKMAIDLLATLACCMGFEKVVTATPQQHDTNIAFTSQLAHVVSNAYVKSPSLFNADGFSAGSFLDLTRVAKLNEHMWSSLFLCNKKALLFELENIINNLEQYKSAIESDDIESLKAILKDGRERKEQSLELYAKHGGKNG
ncbi:MAG: prephenate dehydrogenase [Eubacterium sp.]|nr:prephenate dehydrogenase [Eubacterium sp.]